MLLALLVLTALRKRGVLYCINFNSPPGGSVATIIQSLRGLDVRYEYLGAQPAPIIPTPAGFFIPQRPYDECQCCLVEYNRRPFLGAFTLANLVVGV